MTQALSPLIDQNSYHVPSFCQWETADLAESIILGKATPADDPLWKQSGASSQNEYITWANHVCGMACLKMVLAAQTGRIIPIMQLTRQALAYGAYTINKDNIQGMIYAPFVKFVSTIFSISARIEIDINASQISNFLQDNPFFIASVHPHIRWPERTPPKKGGHLVLVTAADDNSITFHNPSGHTPETRKNAMLCHKSFDRFFAGRGVLIMEDTQ